ncbi:rhamnose ABC transporter substrate-binding protein [candidate division KSB3 bacterium]|uniref:Rhamnose ABC transporter substrate-binding protein n=1 Tax=candidate division KSB3 bacterium TaxID=2044937 RepID=A0A9D5JSM4_9BACT|nr:rhamnose ABC transporter substrate-binding protein [candidate division KSB3 bacterium]MBD3323453.1 rhamnose ABC transporter substrate-binding protein [candidate division KSB3 bacterium]
MKQGFVVLSVCLTILLLGTFAAAEYTIVNMPKNLGNPYFDACNKGAQEAAQELGDEVIYQAPSDADATKQIQMINALIAQKIDGIMISANDPDALVPVGKKAIEAGVVVTSYDAEVGEGGRQIFVNQADFEGIGRIQVQIMAELIDYEGEIAILSAAAGMPNQTAWIEWMLKELEDPKYKDITLVDTVYGDDDDTKSYQKMQGLMKSYPDLKGVISPTSVGIAAGARAITDADAIGEIVITGLGTPNQLRKYVKNGACPKFALWNPVDLGYLTTYVTHHLLTGEITGEPGETFTAGKLGDYTIDENTTVLLGKPFVFDSSNIDEFDF